MDREAQWQGKGGKRMIVDVNGAPAVHIKRELDHDPDTGLEALHVTRVVKFSAKDRHFSFDVKLPKRIADVLKEEDWQFCMKDVTDFAETVVHNALALGVDPKEQERFMHRRLADRLHERFVDHQQKAGNQS